MPKEETGLNHSTDPVGSKSTRADFRETENKTRNAAFQVQSEVFNALQEMSREWMECAKAEVEFGLKLSTKLTAARSVPDAIAAYQEWLNEEIGARAEDARRSMSNGQKFVDASTRLLSNGWMSPSMTT
jgi:phasin protein